jgi:hypothetical protein
MARPAPADSIQAVLGAICPRRPRKDVPVDVLRDRVLFETAYQQAAQVGGTTALSEAADMLERADRAGEAAQLRRYGIELGGRIADQWEAGTQVQRPFRCRPRIRGHEANLASLPAVSPPQHARPGGATA